MRHTEHITARALRQVPKLIDAVGATLPEDEKQLSNAAVDRIIADMLREDLTGEGE